MNDLYIVLFSAIFVIKVVYPLTRRPIAKSISELSCRTTIFYDGECNESKERNFSLIRPGQNKEMINYFDMEFQQHGIAGRQIETGESFVETGRDNE